MNTDISVVKLCINQIDAFLNQHLYLKTSTPHQDLLFKQSIHTFHTGQRQQAASAPDGRRVHMCHPEVRAPPETGRSHTRRW